MPFRESVTQETIDKEPVYFWAAQAVRAAAFRVAAFVHDGSDASDMLWDVLCEEVRAAVDAWEKACASPSPPLRPIRKETR